jgi:hypothetical protein
MGSGANGLSTGALTPTTRPGGYIVALVAGLLITSVRVSKRERVLRFADGSFNGLFNRLRGSCIRRAS